MCLWTAVYTRMVYLNDVFKAFLYGKRIVDRVIELLAVCDELK